MLIEITDLELKTGQVTRGNTQSKIEEYGMLPHNRQSIKKTSSVMRNNASTIVAKAKEEMNELSQQSLVPLHRMSFEGGLNSISKSSHQMPMTVSMLR